MYLPSAVNHQPQINAVLTELVRELAPAVVRIRYEIGQDWSGDWAIFFRILLSDDASQRQHLWQITRLVSERLTQRIDFSSIGVQPYFNFRSQSEQAKMQEPAWA
jgi:hypothetical protein